ncbi:MAG TPA: LLM class flavin-dependent oxidoreductase [Cyclobacteriaceae bacterium]|nr:LLM class flavin-dependent oxidoreductase [Cyclobacteriaceae bacterium]
MELGISTFVETPDTAGVSTYQRMRDLMEEVELADQLGLDVFAVGEHHRRDYIVSSPAVVLAAAAERTKRIKLTSAVTVLSSDDPVRVFQQFATVDLLSGGRAEIMAGRGSFIESFPLFGYDLKDYDNLFSEKLELLIKLNEKERITWKGKHRPAIDNLGVYPRPHQNNIPIWVAIGGTPESVARAANLALPMMLAIIGGSPDRFAPYVKFYRETAEKAGHDVKKLGVGINSHFYVADTSQKAADEFYPPYHKMMTRIGMERGWPPMERPHYDQLRDSHGSLFVGSPQQIIDKILYEYELFKHTRFLAQVTIGHMPHANVMRSIELFGTTVAPVIRKAIAPATDRIHS